MANNGSGAADRPEHSESNCRLDSWKEIASYLRRDVTTVRRWEKREGLPVHRHAHERRDSVYAYAAEIDGWWESRRGRLAHNGQNGPHDGAASEKDTPPSNGNGGATVDVNAVSAINSLTTGRNARTSRWAWTLAATFFVTAIVLGVVLVIGDARMAEDAAVERRFSVLPPAGTSFRDVVVSPDGRHLAFTAASHQVARGKTTLWVQSVDSLQARALPDTEDAFLPFWSSGSNALGFFAEGHLWTVDLAGGPPRSLAVVAEGGGGTWNSDGTIVFAPGRRGALFRVASTGGATTAVTRLGDGERGHVWPDFLPDGTHFTYLAHGRTDQEEDHHVFVAALDNSQRRRVLSVRSGVLHSADGYLYYQRRHQLFAQPFDLRRFEVTGGPIALAGRVLEHGDAYPFKTEFSVSSDGVVTYRPPQRSATRLLWRDRAGRSSPLINTPADHYEPTFAPDESRVAYALFDADPSSRFGFGPAEVRSDIYQLDRATGLATQLTSHPKGEWGPVWSPNGRSMVFSSNRRKDTLELFLKDATSPSGTEVPLVTEGWFARAQSWSSDGRFVVYSAVSPKTDTDLWLLPMSGDRTPIPLLRSEFAEEQGQISPNGRWLAYTSNESGRFEVWVTTFPRPTTKWRISTDGAGDSRWRQDGRELYYVADDRQLMAVSVTTSKTTFEHGPAGSLFDIGVPPYWYGARNLYDVSRDGRFLTMSPVEDDRSAPVTIVLNWAARLRK